MFDYFLWSGLGAVEDLEDCNSFDHAMMYLAITPGSVTLWRRRQGIAGPPQLMAVKVHSSGQWPDKVYTNVGGELLEYPLDEHLWKRMLSTAMFGPMPST